MPPANHPTFEGILAVVKPRAPHRADLFEMPHRSEEALLAERRAAATMPPPPPEGPSDVDPVVVTVWDTPPRAGSSHVGGVGVMAIPTREGASGGTGYQGDAPTSPKLRCVILESPYAGDVGANIEYARRCLRDSLMRGEAPIASHLLYTQPGVLDDNDPDERQRGIDAGLAWGREAARTVVYIDHGISRGMRYGIKRAESEGRPVEYRSIGLR